MKIVIFNRFMEKFHHLSFKMAQFMNICVRKVISLKTCSEQWLNFFGLCFLNNCVLKKKCLPSLKLFVPNELAVIVHIYQMSKKHYCQHWRPNFRIRNLAWREQHTRLYNHMATFLHLSRARKDIGSCTLQDP